MIILQIIRLYIYIYITRQVVIIYRITIKPIFVGTLLNVYWKLIKIIFFNDNIWSNLVKSKMCQRVQYFVFLLFIKVLFENYNTQLKNVWNHLIFRTLSTKRTMTKLFLNLIFSEENNNQYIKMIHLFRVPIQFLRLF